MVSKCHPLKTNTFDYLCIEQSILIPKIVNLIDKFF